jgi:hypothetical protein
MLRPITPTRATLSHVFGDQTEEHRLGVGIAVRQLVLRVRREAPQLRPDLAALIDDLQGAATEHRHGSLREAEPGPGRLERQEPEVDYDERDEEPLSLSRHPSDFRVLWGPR